MSLPSGWHYEVWGLEMPSGFKAGSIVIHCPICGWPVELPVYVKAISPYAHVNNESTLHVSLYDAQVERHQCGPLPGDGRSVIERFCTDGHLDDPTLPERT